MEDLRAQIKACRERNCYGNQKFIPEGVLRTLLTRSVVRRVIAESKIEAHDRRAIEESVMSGNQKTFALLVLIKHTENYRTLVSHDQYRASRTKLDHSLPFERQTLHNILPFEVAEVFYEKQWQFAAPVLPRILLPRQLHAKMILPILRETQIGRGGFGDVFETVWHESHCKIVGLPGQKCVRKEFIRLKTSEYQAQDDFELELRNLSILGNLNHPNIVRLLGAYTHNGKHSLLFPLLSSDLSIVLDGPRPPYFATDLSFLEALADLTSALRHVHHFIAENVNLDLIGCHHDLKPDNILVDGDRLFLADFGLSTFNTLSQDSKSKHRKGVLEYQAPECENIIDEDFPKGNVGRKGDIWALGCIVAEVLTYLLRGTEAVAKFKSFRTFELNGGWKFSAFHKGNRPNDAVGDWLRGLRDGCRVSHSMIIDLVFLMLQIKPEERPDMTTVTFKFRSACLWEVIESIDIRWAEALENHLDLETRTCIALEKARLDCWKSFCQTDDTTQANSEHFFGTRERFKRALEHLTNLSNLLLDAFDDSVEGCRYRLASAIRDELDELCGLLSLEDQRLLTQRVIERTVRFPSNGINVPTGEFTRHARKLPSLSSYVSDLGYVKVMTESENILLQSDLAESELLIDSARIKSLREFGNNATASLDQGSGSRPVLVEWMKYSSPVLSATIGKYRVERVHSVARLFHDSRISDTLQVLRCSGYYHNTADCRFGLIFDFPGPSCQPTTLAELFKRNREDRPYLGDRFSLAHTISESLRAFHQVGWLHKNLTPYNVAFFSSSDEPLTNLLKKPYLIGFNHSRPNDLDTFTDGPSNLSRACKDYQHHEYLRRGSLARYREEFDIYSLGIVLLEIGLWRALEDLTRKKWQTLTPENFRLALIREAKHDSFKQAMGTIYSDAVTACLDDTFIVLLEHEAFDTTREGRTNLMEQFKIKVIDRLASCSA